MVMTDVCIWKKESLTLTMTSNSIVNCAKLNDSVSSNSVVGLDGPC